MPALVAGIHVFLRQRKEKTWMAGTGLNRSGHDAYHDLGLTPADASTSIQEGSFPSSAFPEQLMSIAQNRAGRAVLDDGTFDETFDVVVAGYGFAGGISAIEAA